MNWSGLLVFLSLIVGYTYYTYITYVVPTSKSTTTNPVIDNSAFESSMVKISDDYTVKQSFVGGETGVSEIKLKFLVKDESKYGRIKIRLVDSDSSIVIDEWNIKSKKIKEETVLKLHTEISNAAGKKFMLQIEGNNLSGDEICLYISDQDSYGDGCMYLDDNQLIGDCVFIVVPATVDNSFITKLFCFVFALLLFLLCFLWGTENTKKSISIENVFLISASIIGMAYLLILPAYSVPDEGTHFSTAYEISNRIMKFDKQLESDDLYVIGRDGDVSKDINYMTTLTTYRYIYNNLFNSVDNEAFNNNVLREKRIKRFPMIAHLPQALGITIARAFNLSYSLVLFMGQFFSLISFVILTYLAIRVTPIGKHIFFAVAGLPMILHEATSFSYDGIICGFAFLLIAYLLKLIYDNNSIRLRDYIYTFLVAIILAPCKMVYSFISVIAFLIPHKRFNNKKIEYFFKFVIVIVSISYAVWYNMGEVSNTTAGVHMVEWAGEEGYTVSYLLHNIDKAIMIYVTTIHEQTGYFIDGMLGGSLGWFDVDVPIELTMASILLLMISMNEKEYVYIRYREKLMFCIVFLVISVLIFATMLLAWTPISRDSIVGVQGRYFIPVLPVLLLPFINSVTPQKSIKYKKALVVGNCILNYLVLLRVFEINVSRI
ncbi:MAG: DUF2142 domain-containing protein [Lachnospiraceae bacterium]|nr:DUF2142 domain-containing protein [Lachnospiraceae bacterium]